YLLSPFLCCYFSPAGGRPAARIIAAEDPSAASRGCEQKFLTLDPKTVVEIHSHHNICRTRISGRELKVAEFESAAIFQGIDARERKPGIVEKCPGGYSLLASIEGRRFLRLEVRLAAVWIELCSGSE